jgi:hypothetical protein
MKSGCRRIRKMANKSTRWKYYQPNKKDLKDEYGDCVIRSLTRALNMEWLEVFEELLPYARETQAMPNNKVVYEQYILDKGFKYVGVSNKKGAKRPTVQSFAKEHNEGTYILRVAHHIVTVVDGYFYDTWDSGDKSLYGYWVKE